MPTRCATPEYNALRRKFAVVFERSTVGWQESSRDQRDGCAARARSMRRRGAMQSLRAFVNVEPQLSFFHLFLSPAPGLEVFVVFLDAWVVWPQGVHAIPSIVRGRRLLCGVNGVHSRVNEPNAKVDVVGLEHGAPKDSEAAAR